VNRLVAASALALATLIGLAVACGRYGPPQRVERPTEPTSSVPLTDPGVPR
jgi:predicted small lipoprotein YifL